MKRSEMELVRLRHMIKRMRVAMGALESVMGATGPFGETAVPTTATEIVACLARHDAYLISEAEALAKVPR